MTPTFRRGLGRATLNKMKRLLFQDDRLMIQYQLELSFSHIIVRKASFKKASFKKVNCAFLTFSSFKYSYTIVIVSLASLMLMTSILFYKQQVLLHLPTHEDVFACTHIR